MSPAITRGGKYKILSLVEQPNYPPVGVTDRGHNCAFARLNQPEYIWKIVPHPAQGLQFSIGRFPYTGIVKEEGNAAFATTNSSWEKIWFATLIEHQNAFIITEDLEGTRGWTVEGANAPDARIVIKEIIVLTSDPPQYLPSQLFKIEPLLEE